MPPTLLTLSPDQILPPLMPMREELDEERYHELVASIRARGIIEPLIVTPAEGRYRIVAGFRRWRAAQDAGLLELPCIVRELSDEDALLEMGDENFHREPVAPLDEARYFAVLQEAFGKSVAEVARAVHKSPQYVANRLTVLHGPDDVREALRDGQISLSVALELRRCLHDEDRRFLLGHAISGGATTDLVRRWVVEAIRTRERAPAAAAGQVVEVITAAPDVIMAACEWHRAQVPMDRTLSFRVCGDCYVFLGQLRDRVTADADDTHGGTPDASHG